MTETRVSYGQNGEDVVLWRALGHLTERRYVDVGANHPVHHSVTWLFYENGWRGVDVEPVEHFADLLASARPGQRRGAGRGVRPPRAASSSSTRSSAPGSAPPTRRLAEAYADKGFSTVRRTVPSRDAGRTCRAWRGPRRRRGDPLPQGRRRGRRGRASCARPTSRPWRPWVVVVEATRPLSTEQSYAEWEPLLLQAGYRFCLFDGLSRYYVAEEHAELARAAVVPVLPPRPLHHLDVPAAQRRHRRPAGAAGAPTRRSMRGACAQSVRLWRTRGACRRWGQPAAPAGPPAPGRGPPAAARGERPALQHVLAHHRAASAPPPRSPAGCCGDAAAPLRAGGTTSPRPRPATSSCSAGCTTVASTLGVPRRARATARRATDTAFALVEHVRDPAAARRGVAAARGPARAPCPTSRGACDDARARPCGWPARPTSCTACCPGVDLAERTCRARWRWSPTSPSSTSTSPRATTCTPASSASSARRCPAGTGAPCACWSRGTRPAAGLRDLAAPEQDRVLRYRARRRARTPVDAREPSGPGAAGRAVAHHRRAARGPLAGRRRAARRRQRGQPAGPGRLRLHPGGVRRRPAARGAREVRPVPVPGQALRHRRGHLRVGGRRVPRLLADAAHAGPRPAPRCTCAPCRRSRARPPCPPTASRRTRPWTPAACRTCSWSAARTPARTTSRSSTPPSGCGGRASSSPWSSPAAGAGRPTSSTARSAGWLVGRAGPCTCGAGSTTTCCGACTQRRPVHGLPLPARGLRPARRREPRRRGALHHLPRGQHGRDRRGRRRAHRRPRGRRRAARGRWAGCCATTSSTPGWSPRPARGRTATWEQYADELWQLVDAGAWSAR